MDSCGACQHASASKSKCVRSIDGRHNSTKLNDHPNDACFRIPGGDVRVVMSWLS